MTRTDHPSTRRLTAAALAAAVLAAALAVGVAGGGTTADEPPPGGDAHAHQETHPATDHDHGNAHAPLAPLGATAGSVYHLDHAWRDQHARVVELGGFSGRPVLVTMFYGNCTTACPLLLHKARLLQEALGGDVPVLAVTFDPVSDTPEAMRRYAAERGFDGAEWHFLMGAPTSIRMLATLLGVQYRRRADGHYDHSNLIALLDADGIVRVRSEGLAPDVAPIAAEIFELGVLPR